MEIYGKITRNSIATLTDHARYMYQRLILHYLTAQQWKGTGSSVQLSSPLMSGALSSFPTLSQKTAISFLFMKIVYRNRKFITYTYGINMFGGYYSSFILRISRASSQSSSSFHVNVIVYGY